MASQIYSSRTEQAVYVYRVSVRIWHWVNALAITVLAITGYLIGSPPPSLSGEASDHYLMGYIRFAHFAAGYIFVIGFIGRVYWAIFGGDANAREIFILPVWRKSFWRGVWHELRWYLFLEREPHKYIGHNPLARLIMHFAFVWCALFLIITGMALYGEGTGMDSWQYQWFSSWVIPLFGQSQDVHTWHHLAMWAMICFAIVHVYAAIREDIMSRQSILSSMVSGWRSYYDNRKISDD
jgi:Ni/Fe-hydrogenase 1 B-type cytochrome subunit